MAVPALVNDVSWGLAFSMYAVIIGQFLGSDMVAANSFVSQVRSFATVLCFSLASGGGILLGHLIGDDRMEEADRAASAVMRLTEAGKGYLRVMLLINSYYVESEIIATADVRACVETVLRERGLAETARHYMEYRK